MRDSSRSIPRGIDVEIGKVGGSGKKNIKWFEEKLREEEDNIILKEEGKALFEKTYGDSTSSHTIFKPKRKADGREPPELIAVAIGPYRRNWENLQKFGDEYKLKITRFMNKHCSLNTEKYLEEMKKKEEVVRSRYNNGLSEWSSEEFRTMLLLDSSFVLFVMDAFCNNPLDFSSWFMDYMNLHRDQDTLMEYMALSLGVREHLKQIKLDLLTVDNQIPLSAIEQLLGCFPKGSRICKESIEELALRCFRDFWPMENIEQVSALLSLLKKMRNEEHDVGVKFSADFFLPLETRSVPDQFYHLLHLFHWSRIPKEGYEMGGKGRGSKNTLRQYIPSATELQKSATKFKKKDPDSSYLDITFNSRLAYVSGVINIPTLRLYDYSKPIFHNLIAFEATPANNVLCFTAYVACMSCILQREDDVKLLRERGIVASTNYKDADVVDFFAELNGEIEEIEMPYTLLELYYDVTNHHNNQISKWWGNFMLQYCSNFWVALSLVAAIVLFALSLLQTIYGMLTYYVPEKK